MSNDFAVVKLFTRHYISTVAPGIRQGVRLRYVGPVNGRDLVASDMRLYNVRAFGGVVSVPI